VREKGFKRKYKKEIILVAQVKNVKRERIEKG
jgi:hypothetical protein